MKSHLLPIAAMMLLSATAQQLRNDTFIVTGQPIRTDAFIEKTDASGTVVRDPDAPVSFGLPPEWVLIGGARWGQNETTLMFKDRDSGITAALYYQHPYQIPREHTADTELLSGMDNKVVLRQREGFTEYTIRAYTIQKRTVGDLPAISFVAQYTRDTHPKVEYMVRVLGSGTKAHFFVTLRPEVDLNAFLKSFDGIVETLKIR
jgi:hypothetical protein